jgi:serine/threonine-protein kinase
VILYEMLTGGLPFRGPDFLAQKRAQELLPPSQAAPGLPPSLDATISRALQPDPARRFRSAAELSQALEAA